MPFSIKQKIRSGYLFALLLLLVSFVLIIRNIYLLKQEARAVSHTYDVINNLVSLARHITEVETAARGFVITNDSAYLPLYHESSRKIPLTRKFLRESVENNERQLQRLDTLDYLVDERIRLFAFGIRTYRDAHFTFTDTLVALRGKSRNIMDSIRLYIQYMTTAEDDQLNKKNTEVSGFFQSTRNLTISSLLIAILAIVYSMIIYNKESRAKKNAFEKAINYEKELELNIKKLEAINKELTELKDMEQFVATGRVAHTIAHEVRNPLTNISLATGQMQQLGDHNEEMTLLLDMVNRNSIRINQLVSDLLNATKFIQLDRVKTPIDKLIDETLDLASDRLELGHIKVIKQYNSGHVSVLADTEKLKVAFLNIIINAVEAMDHNTGVLRISTSRQDHKCIIRFTDNGSGMDEETQGKLFEPFFTRKPKGYGLGLTNTQNIIFSHKGNINVISRPGEGTIFSVVLDIV